MQNTNDDRAYFEDRSRQERERAAASRDTEVALVHLQMADEYERRAEVRAPMPRAE